MSRLFSDTPGSWLAASSAIRTGPPFTVVAWFNTNDITDDFQNIFGIGQAGVDENFRLRMRITSGFMDWEADGAAGTGRARATLSIGANAWHHVAAVEETTTSRRCLVDGANEGTNTSSAAPAGLDETWIGQLDDGSPADRFNGYIGHVFVYSVALTNVEIRGLALGKISPLQVRLGSHVAYWALNGRSPEPSIIGNVPMVLNGSPPLGPEPPIYRPIVAPG